MDTKFQVWHGGSIKRIKLTQNLVGMVCCAPFYLSGVQLVQIIEIFTKNDENAGMTMLCPQPVF